MNVSIPVLHLRALYQVWNSFILLFAIYSIWI